MTEIVLIGTGNVARHLFEAFTASGKVAIVQVAGRNEKALEYFKDRAHTTTDFSALKEVAIYVLAVSDDAIGPLAHKLNLKTGLLAHTSGTTPLNALPDTAGRGVFYPLQTFSSVLEVNFKEVPIGIEAENESDIGLLEELASTISNYVQPISSENRRHLHTAAVFVNNFSNHLFHIGQQLCEEKGLSFELLKPLIRETIRKIDHMSPFEAQTGPARRGDSQTLQSQMGNLKNESYQSIYQTISKSIQQTYAEQL